MQPPPKPILGSKDQPIRASLLPNLFKCPRFYMEKVIGDGNDIAGKDAHTGNLVHVGIQAYHQSGMKENQGKIAIEIAAKVYPLGSTDDAIRLFEKYHKRETSERRGTVIHSEVHIEAKIPAADFDPTKEEIVIHGTVDQIRQIGRDTLYVVDHKTGRTGGADMVLSHMPQLAVYMLGVMDRFPDKKVEGFITRIQDLCRINLPYWWRMPMNGREGVLGVLKVVQHRIALLRMGIYDATPGKWCEWCPLANYPACDTMELGFRPKPDGARIADAIAEKLKPKGKITMDQLFGGK